MRSITLSCVVIVLVLGGAHELGASPKIRPSVLAGEGQYNKNVEIRQGNHSYLPLNIAGNSAGHVKEILAALNGFEKAYPELEITGWMIESQSAYIFGLWVDHKPKAPKGRIDPLTGAETVPL